jgi:nicotinamide riboside transporter PnuC
MLYYAANYAVFVGLILIIKKKNEGWLLWAAAALMGVVMYSTEFRLYYWLVTYEAIEFAISMLGFFTWQKLIQQNKTHKKKKL